MIAIVLILRRDSRRVELLDEAFTAEQTALILSEAENQFHDQYTSIDETRLARLHCFSLYVFAASFVSCVFFWIDETRLGMKYKQRAYSAQETLGLSKRSFASIDCFIEECDMTLLSTGSS